MSQCQHIALDTASRATAKFTYRQPLEEVRRAALQESHPVRKKAKKSNKSNVAHTSASNAAFELPPESSFPAPVVLGDSELAYDPDYPAQSVQEWIDEEHRNEVTAKRRTIYVVPPPTVSNEVSFVSGWSEPRSSLVCRSKSSKQPPRSERPSTQPVTEDIVEYLQAFYHGLPVKLLEQPALRFTAWDSGEESGPANSAATAKDVPFIGLSTGSEAIRIRARPSLDKTFTGQLNLNDLLDVAISILPKDAYAIVMLVHHDLYESDDDDFCCGRAYGGSRVAVVSSARNRPELDNVLESSVISREHSWPASHCSAVIASSLGKKSLKLDAKQAKCKTASECHPGSALAAAVDAANALPLPSSPSELDAMWLGRVCKTTSHELGHCFGIDHCVYYACIMQSTANLADDSRQPPYLCPIDLSKVLRATGTSEKDRDAALLKVCEKWSKDRMFAAFEAWLRVRMQETEAVPL